MSEVPLQVREKDLLVRNHFIIVMIRWTGLAPREFEFPFPGYGRKTGTTWVIGAVRERGRHHTSESQSLFIRITVTRSHVWPDVGRCGRKTGITWGDRYRGTSLIRNRTPPF